MSHTWMAFTSLVVTNESEVFTLTISSILTWTVNAGQELNALEKVQHTGQTILLYFMTDQSTCLLVMMDELDIMICGNVH